MTPQRAVYRWGRAQGVVWLEDLDQGASITNDAERVIGDLAQLGVDPDAQPILYRDTQGRWDRIVTANGRVRGFAPLGGKDLDEAVQICRATGSGIS